MKADYTYLYLTFAVIILLVAPTACDYGSSQVTSPDHVTLTFETTDTSQPNPTGTYTVGGAFYDRGTFEEHISMSSGNESLTTVYGWRNLKGDEGTAQIQYSGYAQPGARHVSGTSSVVLGTGSYADFVGGEGEFELEVGTGGSPGPSSLTIRR